MAGNEKRRDNLLTSLGCALAAAMVMSASFAQALTVGVHYESRLAGTCPLVSGCSFGSPPAGFSAAQGEAIEAELLISFVLDTSSPLFSVGAGEPVPGTSLSADFALVSYGADAISDLKAEFAGVDLLSDPRFGLSEGGFDLGASGIVPGVLLFQEIEGISTDTALNIAFGTPGPASSTFRGAFITAGNTRPADRNRVVSTFDNAVFALGDDNGVFNLNGGLGGASFTTTVVPIPAPAALLLSGLTILGLQRRRKSR